MTEKPQLGDAARTQVEAIFDRDLADLGGWLGAPLTCADFTAAADRADWTWRRIWPGGGREEAA